MDRHRLLLVAASQEIADIRRDAASLSDLASELMAFCPEGAKRSALIRMQAFDLLIQRLDGLSELSAALGAGVPVETALHGLLLVDQRRRLSADPRALPHPSSSDGSVLLFD
ncbi:MAG: hypothetical protein EON96_15070 [Caulobacteraceae bacterium]|nr:MAG: hypothetical protein EON96_15070 [Caulobacteraceae bacterium]